MGKHTRTGHRSTGVAAAVAAGRSLRGRRRHAAPSAGTARRIAAPAALAALLLTSGGTAGTAFAGTGSDDDSSGASADCPDGSTPVGGSCSGDAAESSSGSSGGLGDLVTGADVVGSVLGAGGPGSGSSGGDTSDRESGTTNDDSGADSSTGSGRDSGGKDSGTKSGKDSDTKSDKDSDTKSGGANPGTADDESGTGSGGKDSSGTKDSGSASTGPLDAVPGLGDLTGGLGKGVDLNTPTKPLTSLPDPAQTLSDAGSSVPGAGQAGSLVDTAVGAAGTVVGTDTGNSPLAGPTDTLTGLGDVVPELPSVPGVTDGTTDELPDVPGVTAGGPLEGLNEIAGLPDTTPLTGKDGPLSYSLSSCGAMERISTADPVTDAVPKLPTANVPGTPYVSGPGLQG